MPHIRIPRLAGVLAAAALAAHPLAAQQGCRTVQDPARLPVHGATLRMAPVRYTIGDSTFVTNVYNGSFVAPSLVMQPGQRMDLQVVNAMRATAWQAADKVADTNQHYHGLVVTPRPEGGDNVTNVHIPTGGPARQYDFLVPAIHTQGMFWYHPHPHGSTGSQVAGGLSGALMVGSILTYFPRYRGVQERTLLVRDMSFQIGNTLLNINGSTCALLPVPQGQKQLWHIGNFNANTFLNLKMPGTSWTLLALDGNPLSKEMQIDSLYLPPGSRAEVIVTGPPAGTRTVLITAPVDPAPTAPADTLGYLVGTAPQRARALALGRQPAGEDASVVDTLRFLREAKVVGRQRFTFQFLGETSAGIDSVQYEPTNAPVNVPWGQVQEWTLVNQTDALHTFHIHQTDFWIVSVNGVAEPDRVLRDNVPLGVHPDGKGGFEGDTVVVRFVFDPIAEGPFVFHCHVLQHEDEGMMHNVCVYDPRDPNGPNKCNSYFSGNAGHAGH
jgi:FtsP/CotA-like multicopper oxidase with cupredoxin domain